MVTFMLELKVVRMNDVEYRSWIEADLRRSRRRQLEASEDCPVSLSRTRWEVPNDQAAFVS